MRPKSKLQHPLRKNLNVHQVHWDFKMSANGNEAKASGDVEINEAANSALTKPAFSWKAPTALRPFGPEFIPSLSRGSA
jgi:hypothetical protein